MIREVSWANVREKLSAGIFDVAHLLAPMAIASSLDLMPGSVPLTAPYVLATNGNAITVSPMLFREIMAEVADEEPRPLATAKALARIAARRKREGFLRLHLAAHFLFRAIPTNCDFGWRRAGSTQRAISGSWCCLPLTWSKA